MVQGENEKDIQQLLQTKMLFDVYKVTTIYPVILKISRTLLPSYMKKKTNNFLSYILSLFCI